MHPAALVESADIGPGTRIWAFAHVMPDVRIGRDCNIGDNVFLESGVVLGDGVTVKKPGAALEGRGGRRLRLHRSERRLHQRSVSPQPRLPLLKIEGYSEQDWLAEMRVDEVAASGAIRQVRRACCCCVHLFVLIRY